MANALDLIRTTESVGLEVYKQIIEDQFANNERLQEALTNVSAMLSGEDQGWATLGAGGEYEMGLQLWDLKKWAREIREAVAGNAHIKQGLKLRSNFVWQRGIRYANIKGKSKGRGANVQARIDNPKNQRNFFCADARAKREAALFSDSAYFVLGDKKDYTLQTVPIWEIWGHYSNPDDHGEVWAYLRVWDHIESGFGIIPNRMWYLTDAHPSYYDKSVPRPTVVNYGGVNEPVHPTITMFDGHVNGQVGWPYGVPDALSALVWARLYRDFLVNGKIMSDALATFAFKATASTKAGANAAAMAFADAQAPGQTAIVGAADNLVPIGSAGKGYDFASGDALAAVIAASLEVSSVHITANPAAGGSYGATSTLDLPTQLAVLARRQWHIDFDTRILKFLGADDPVVTFNSTDSLADLFRQIQALLLMWASGLYQPEPIEARLSELMDIVGNTVPDGVIIQNNSKMPDLLSTDRTANPNVGNPLATTGNNQQGKGTSTANGNSPAQGKATGVGKTGNANDMRTDRLANMLEMLNAFIASEKDIEDREQRSA